MAPVDKILAITGDFSAVDVMLGHSCIMPNLKADAERLLARPACAA